MGSGKAFWKSKTFWVNLLALGAMVGQNMSSNFVISSDMQVGILAVVNVVLRLVTKEPLNWS